MPELANRLSESGPPPRFAGALPLLGHMAKFARDPVAMMQQVRAACGPVGEFRMPSSADRAAWTTEGPSGVCEVHGVGLDTARPSRDHDLPLEQ